MQGFRYEQKFMRKEHFREGVTQCLIMKLYNPLYCSGFNTVGAVNTRSTLLKQPVGQITCYLS